MFDTPIAAEPAHPSALTGLEGAAATHAALVSPRLSLSSCVRSYLVRSTLGVELSPQQRQNHFPASPYCCLMWLLQGGSTCIVRGGLPTFEVLPRLSFIGPHTGPSVSANPGPVHSFMVVLLPQAAQALTGIDLASLVNRVVPMDSVLDAAWLAMAQAVQHATDDDTRVQCIEAFLEPRWRAVCREVMPLAERQRYWVESLAMRAATSGMGRSLRQVERRIKDWAGLPLRDLRRLTRSEESFVETRDTFLSNPAGLSPSWADVAADGGYSDQSHLCRETRRVSGLSPNGLKRAVAEEESFWAYRIWG